VVKYQCNAEGELKKIEGKVDEEGTEIAIKLPSLSKERLFKDEERAENCVYIRSEKDTEIIESRKEPKNSNKRFLCAIDSGRFFEASLTCLSRGKPKRFEEDSGSLIKALDIPDLTQSIIFHPGINK